MDRQENGGLDLLHQWFKPHHFIKAQWTRSQTYQINAGLVQVVFLSFLNDHLFFLCWIKFGLFLCHDVRSQVETVREDHVIKSFIKVKQHLKVE